MQPNFIKYTIKQHYYGPYYKCNFKPALGILLLFFIQVSIRKPKPSTQIVVLKRRSCETSVVLVLQLVSMKTSNDYAVTSLSHHLCNLN